MTSTEADMRRALYAEIVTLDVREGEYLRQRLEHELLTRAMGGKLIRVPQLPPKPMILDSAAGNGLWMLEASKELSADAKFYGTGVDPRRFTHIKDLPSNITLKQHSVLDTWPYSYRSAFNLVHQKYCLSTVDSARAVHVVMRLVECAKPGGYVQLVEPDISDYRTNYGTDGEHTGFRMLAEFINKASSIKRRNPNPGHYVKSWLEQAGLEDVHQEVVTYEVGVSEKDPEYAAKSEVAIMSMVSKYESLASKIPGYFYTEDDFAKLKAELEKELRTVGNRWKVHIAWGRWPR